MILMVGTLISGIQQIGESMAAGVTFITPTYTGVFVQGGALFACQAGTSYLHGHHFLQMVVLVTVGIGITAPSHEIINYAQGAGG